MKTQNKAFPFKHLIVMTAAGTLDLAASKTAVKSLVAEPSFDERCEVLLDFRDIECAMSAIDIFELAEHIGFPNPALPTKKKIAVLVTGHRAFDHAQFLELCASNRGLKIGAFEDYDDADAWLNADLPHDPTDIAPVLPPATRLAMPLRLPCT